MKSSRFTRSLCKLLALGASLPALAEVKTWDGGGATNNGAIKSRRSFGGLLHDDFLEISEVR